MLLTVLGCYHQLEVVLLLFLAHIGSAVVVVFVVSGSVVIGVVVVVFVVSGSVVINVVVASSGLVVLTGLGSLVIVVVSGSSLVVVVVVV